MLLIRKMKIDKTKPTIISILVLKVDIMYDNVVGLVFLISNFLNNKISQANKLSAVNLHKLGFREGKHSNMKSEF